MSANDTAAVLAKVTRRIIPFLFILYVGAFLDRVNVSVAKLTMLKDLGYSETVYATGAGIFFIGYFIFEVPSNLILAKTGARVWIARIMITWGIISSLMMFAKTPTTFYVLRFLLGAAEAGFFPGMIYYLTNWYPAIERAKAISRFMMAIPIAYMFGNPLGGALLLLDGRFDLKGWQWLFLLEGIPSILMGIATLFYLTDSPQKAHWLTDDEKGVLSRRLELEKRRKEAHRSVTFWEWFRFALRVGLLCAIYLSIVVGGYGLALNLPSIVKTMAGQNNFMSSLISSIPYICAAIAMILIGRSSDRTKERKWHIAISCFIGAVGMAMAAVLKDPLLGLIGLCLASIGQTSTLAPFWAMSTSFLTGTLAAGAIAFINSVGNLGGYFGPQVMGRIKDSTHSFESALLILAGILALAGVLTLAAHHDPSLETAPEEHVFESPEEEVLESLIQ